MSKKSIYPPELKEEILSKVRDGMSVKEIEQRYGVSTKTVYKWLGGATKGAINPLLELSRLKRENEALYKTIGRITHELKSGKKI